MKKIFTHMLFMLLALPTVMTLTSCDRDSMDRAEARTLDGTWTGYIDTYYYNRWHKRGDTYRTSIYFERSNPYGGRGYEVDYNIASRYADYYCEFSWEVINGRIHIKYDDSWGKVIIYDYTLTDTYFDGFMDDGTTRDIRFHLNYDGAFDWGGWRNTWRRSQAIKPEKTDSVK